jgi:hypothetical protein
VTTRYRLAFHDDAGVRGRVELDLVDGGRARYEALVVLPGIGTVIVREADIAPPRGRLIEVHAEGLWAELVCEVADEHWGFGLEAFGLRFDTEEEAETSELGDRVPVGLDLEWEVGDEVRGEILVGRDRISFDGAGTFSVAEGSGE